ncbi:DUF2179 domain-containing protein [Anaerotalea alkaliphila]|nr:DUF5698 domain-containing protein [Anaerotalea alkaliphila]
MTGRILLYLVILLAKVFEVTLATTRIVMITKGERGKGAIIGFFEIIIWVVLVSTVLKDITADPIKIFIYALGFSLGNFFGSIFEEKLGLGTTRMEVIAKEEQGKDLVDALRAGGYAVTVIDGEGMHHKRNVLVLHVPRKKTKEVVNMIKGYQEEVVITVNEVKPVYGGYGIIKK